jgi:hypothetical protein
MERGEVMLHDRIELFGAALHCSVDSIECSLQSVMFQGSTEKSMDTPPVP